MLFVFLFVQWGYLHHNIPPSLLTLIMKWLFGHIFIWEMSPQCPMPTWVTSPLWYVQTYKRHGKLVGYSFIHSFIHPFVNLFIEFIPFHSIFHSLLHSFNQSIIQSSLQLIQYSSIHLSIHSFIHPFIYPFILQYLNQFVCSSSNKEVSITWYIHSFYRTWLRTF